MITEASAVAFRQPQPQPQGQMLNILQYRNDSILSLRDPNDLHMLALLIGPGADHLVTGDKGLQALAGTHPILTPADFAARIAP